MRVSELSGAELDAAVARVEGFPQCGLHTEDGVTVCFLGPVAMERFTWSPSTVWEQGGPIIEREQIALVHFGDAWGAFHRSAPDSGWWDEHSFDVGRYDAVLGPTPLIAAMRAYVASKSVSPPLPSVSPKGE